MHVGEFVRGKGYFAPTPYVATDERTTGQYPLLLTTGRILSQYNVGAQTRRTRNVDYHAEDELEIHPSDAEVRGIKTDDWVGIKSRAGETVLRAIVTDRVQPGVLYTTFHHPESGANVVTTVFKLLCPLTEIVIGFSTRVSFTMAIQKSKPTLCTT